MLAVCSCDPGTRTLIHAAPSVLVADSASSFHRHILLNGRELRLTPDGSLPPFRPKHWNMTKPLIMPPLSMVFWVIQEVHAPACEGQWQALHSGVVTDCTYTHQHPQLRQIPRPPSSVSESFSVIFIKHCILQHHPLAENIQLRIWNLQAHQRTCPFSDIHFNIILTSVSLSPLLSFALSFQ